MFVRCREERENGIAERSERETGLIAGERERVSGDRLREERMEEEPCEPPLVGARMST